MNVKVINPGKHVQEVLALTGLDSVFDVCPASAKDEVHALLRECACAET
jgi:hypothetical protein